MGKKGHGHLSYGAKRPRDGRMGQKDEGDHWEENEAQMEKAYEEPNSSWQ